MTKLVWGADGERLFEAGVDRGVLYLKGDEGVPWNGLISVAINPTGGDPEPYYIDGFKYANLATAEEFAATITAFGAPASFARCEGTQAIHSGLFVTEQPRLPFDFCYRTKLGNDILGVDHGYKLHLIYNALAAPSTRSNTTLSNETDPMSLSWPVSTRPVMIPGIKPTSHLVVDSTLTDPDILLELETFLYGSDDVPSALPSMADVIDIFTPVVV